MKIHEYQAKEILRGFGVATPEGIACFSVNEAVAAAKSRRKKYGSLKRKSMPAGVARAAA